MPPTKSIKISSLPGGFNPPSFVPLRNYFSVGFKAYVNSTFHCSVKVTNSSTFYLMNKTEYQYSGQHNWLPNSSIFLFSAVIDNSTSTFSVNIPSGSWEAVFVNTNLNISTSVSIESMYWTLNSPWEFWGIWV